MNVNMYLISVIVVQELYKSWPACLDYRYAERLISLAAQKGFRYATSTSGFQWPSVCMDTGSIFSIMSIQPRMSLTILNMFANQV